MGSWCGVERKNMGGMRCKCEGEHEDGEKQSVVWMAMCMEPCLHGNQATNGSRMEWVADIGMNGV